MTAFTLKQILLATCGSFLSFMKAFSHPVCFMLWFRGTCVFYSVSKAGAGFPLTDWFSNFTRFQTIMNYSILLVEEETSLANKRQAVYPIREARRWWRHMRQRHGNWTLSSWSIFRVKYSTQIFQLICFLDTKHQFCLTYPGIIGKKVICIF